MGYELLQMLSDIFEEEVDKNNLKSVLERQGNLNISFGNNNIIGYINVCSERTTDENKNQPKDFQEPTDKLKIEMLRKLRQFGLKDEQISEAIGLSLEQIKQLVSDE
ncbi:MAG TPA: hypothetical protein V6D28_12775 [Leptolyngbyaceae cyanobacterium]